MDVHGSFEDSDEDIEKQPPATKSAPRGARRFSEKYSETEAQVKAAACPKCSLRFTEQKGVLPLSARPKIL